MGGGVLSWKMDANPGKLSPLSRICLKKLWHVWFTLASTNINQSAPNFVKMYVTTSSQLSLIMNVIGPELSELFALEFAKIADFVYTLASTSLDHLSNNRGHNIYIRMRS